MFKVFGIRIFDIPVCECGSRVLRMIEPGPPLVEVCYHCGAAPEGEQVKLCEKELSSCEKKK